MILNGKQAEAWFVGNLIMELRKERWALGAQYVTKVKRIERKKEERRRVYSNSKN